MLPIAQSIEPTLSGMGYELVDVEMAPGGILRVYIDRPSDGGEGIGIGDCERVSHQLGHLLTVEAFDYERLEVSSPGLDRPLRKAGDFERFAGNEITLKLRQAFQGRRSFEGTLSVESDGRFGLELIEWREVQAPRRGRPVRVERPSGPAAKRRGATRLEAVPTGKKLIFKLDEVERARLVPRLSF